MKLAHIVAVSRNGVIGRDGGMPWHIKADFKHFKQTTMGACLIMGRKTFASIGKPLPGRYSIVLTHQKDFAAEGAVVVHTIDDALKACAAAPAEYRRDLAFIIGGGELYRASIAMVDTIFLTRIDRDAEGDTYYSDPSQFGFRLSEETKAEEGDVGFAFQTFVREK